MQKVDVVKHIEGLKDAQKQGGKMKHYEASFNEISKISMKSNFKTREHTFEDGDISQVVDEITIKIKFNNAVIQPHVDFDTCLEEAIIDFFCQEFDGLIENADQ